MTLRLLFPYTCRECGQEYWEVGYWRDAEYCPACSVKQWSKEQERKKDLRRRATEAREKYGLDLDKYPDEIPEEVRRELNPRNAGRKPVKYESEYCEILVERAAEGKTEAEFAAEIKVTQALLTYWTNNHKKFKEARETANELRLAWFERTYRDAMLTKIPCVSSMMIRMAAAKYGWHERTESVVSGGGEIPVVRIVQRDEDFPTETIEPSKEQMQEAGLGAEA